MIFIAGKRNSEHFWSLIWKNQVLISEIILYLFFFFSRQNVQMIAQEVQHFELRIFFFSSLLLEIRVFLVKKIPSETVMTTNAPVVLKMIIFILWNKDGIFPQLSRGHWTGQQRMSHLQIYFSCPKVLSIKSSGLVNHFLRGCF